jgi:hypothetical protein
MVVDLHFKNNSIVIYLNVLKNMTMNTTELLELLDAFLSAGLDNSNLVIVPRDVASLTLSEYFDVAGSDKNSPTGRGIYVYANGLDLDLENTIFTEKASAKFSTADAGDIYYFKV